MKSKDGLYIQLYHIHGLFRGENLELGRDADTGGQTKYVLELAIALSKRDDVKKVEVITRYIKDKEVSEDYAVSREKVNDKFTIVRIRAGGSKYLRKELLWDYMEEFTDKSIKYIKSTGTLPDVIHSHYADAGYVCTKLKKFFGIPYIHTGHSLGRTKLGHLMKQGMLREDIEKRYKISTRIDAEEDAIYYADRIITSTSQEIEKQYGEYSNFEEEKFTVIPPGVDLEKFHSYRDRREFDDENQNIRDNIGNELWRFFTNLHKPLILSLCRPEKRKNISGLITAFGEDKELQKMANLAIFAGIRKDIHTMPDIEREVLTEMLLLMDKYNLYGKMAIPKRHDVEYEVPELYRIAAETQGVFVNSAYSEPFGLTLIEAGASGLPIVSTDDGGPRDIVGNLDNGMLVDVSDPANIADGIKEVLSNELQWQKYSQNGVNRIYNYYSWDAHAETYMNMLRKTAKEVDHKPGTFVRTGKKLFNFEKFMIFDIDDTLTGDKEALAELNDLLENRDESVGFGVATGRTVDSAREKLKEIGVMSPEVIISSVGSELYYNNGEEYVASNGWRTHISEGWKRANIVEILKEVDFLEYQPEENQREYKVSYYIRSKKKFNTDEIQERLVKARIKANVIISHNENVDILPFRASKGRAVRYLAYRWNISHSKVLVAGDSGNDEDMLTGEILGVIVANHGEELKKLKGRRRIYFAKKPSASGVMEGIKHYKFLTKD